MFSGYLADIFNRKKNILTSISIYIACAIMLFLFTDRLSDMLVLYGTMFIYVFIAVTGLQRSFLYPAQTALMAQLVLRELYANSSTWNSTKWHIVTVSGLAVGGLMYGFAGVSIVYHTLTAL